MKTTLITLFFVLSLVCNAEEFSPEKSGQTYLQKQMQEGRLINVTLTLGNPLKIFVTGKEEAQLNLTNLKLRVRRLDPYAGEELIFNKEGQFYTVKMPVTQKLDGIEVITTLNNQTEAFHFKINYVKP
ncbi:MAG: hypothetical protein V4654_00560 [Bdellovibrionota bacterium]